MKKILAVSISLLFAMAAIAQEQRKPQTFTERYGEQLGLTGEQKKVIDGMENKFNEEHEKFLTEYRQTMSDYRDARQANDQAKIDALKPKVDAQRAEMMKLRGTQEERIETTLTNDQKAKWSKIKEERAARMKERDQQHQ